MATSPQGPVELPWIVTELAAGRPVRAVWQNEVGALTFQVGLGDARQFVKWTPTGSGIDLSAEVVRLRWAVAFTVVPGVVDEGADEMGSWIVTAGRPGRMAVDDHWKRDPGTAVRTIGTGLRALHEQLPVADCPFGWSAGQRLEAVRARATAGLIDPADWPEDFQLLGTVERALRLLTDIPPVDEPVVCHGDACAPAVKRSGSQVTRRCGSATAPSPGTRSPRRTAVPARAPTPSPRSRRASCRGRT